LPTLSIASRSEPRTAAGVLERQWLRKSRITLLSRRHTKQNKDENEKEKKVPLEKQITIGTKRVKQTQANHSDKRPKLKIAEQYQTGKEKRS